MKIKILMTLVLLMTGIAPLLAQNEAAMIMPEERLFTVGGWMDLIGKQEFSDDIPRNDDKNFQFAQADLNLYFNFMPHKDLSCFVEISYSYYPGPSKNFFTLNQTYYNNTVLDLFGVSEDWGTINIVRAYMEWHKFKFFEIRVGRMLTPYGIWSQDHGQTVVTPIRPPSILAPFSPSDSVPQSITGIELLGQVNLGQAGEWGNALFDYAAYVANNDTDLDSMGDSDQNWFKSCGAYFNFKVPVSVVTLDFGMSYYEGKFIRLGYTNALTEKDYYQYNSLNNILLAHLKMSADVHRNVQIILQGEFKQTWSDRQEVRWDLTHMPLLVLGKPGSYTEYAVYGLAEFKFFGIFSVYYMINHDKSDSKNSFVNKTLGHSAGITIWPYPMLAIKGQYTRGYVLDANKTLIGEGIVDQLYIAMAMSF